MTNRYTNLKVFEGTYTVPGVSDMDDLPPRSVRIKTGYGVLGPNREHLAGGSEYVLPGPFADALIASGRAVDATTGVGRVEPPIVAPKQTSHSGNIRVRMLPPFAVAVDGVHKAPGEEFSVSNEFLTALGDRVERLDIPKKRKAKPARSPGEPHPILILGRPEKGMGVHAGPLGHIEFGAEVVVPDSLAQLLIGSGRARSLRPEQPNPDAVELAELLGAGKDKKTKDRVIALASKLLRGKE